MKIYAPVKDFNGIRNNVRFVNGVGETDNTVVALWFQTRGYRVEDEKHRVTLDPLEKCEEITEIPVEKCDEPDFESMNPNELRDWAKANGFGSQIKNTRNKEKLLEIIRG